MLGGDNTTIIPASLPNITGTVWDVVSTSGGLHSSGAFTATNVGRGGGDSAWRYGAVQFDASRCSDIYANVDTVMPATIQLFPQIKY